MTRQTELRLGLRQVLGALGGVIAPDVIQLIGEFVDESEFRSAIEIAARELRHVPEPPWEAVQKLVQLAALLQEDVPPVSELRRRLDAE